MSLVDLTDFNEALLLLGRYEQEVMKTGILDYPVQWPLPQLVSPTLPTSAEDLPSDSKPQALPALPEPTAPIVMAQDNVPAVEIFSDSAITADSTVNCIEVTIQAKGLVKAKDPLPEVAETDAELKIVPPPPCSLAIRRQALLTEQEEERRLFYRFVEEVEQTGDLRKLPAVLRPALHTH